MVGRNIIVLLTTEYDHFRTECLEIIYVSEISNGDDVEAEVWDEYKSQQVPDTILGKYQDSFLTNNDRKLNMSRNISRNLKEIFQDHKRK